jgi:hypothetical protein
MPAAVGKPGTFAGTPGPFSFPPLLFRRLASYRHRCSSRGGDALETGDALDNWTGGSEIASKVIGGKRWLQRKLKFKSKLAMRPSMPRIAQGSNKNFMVGIKGWLNRVLKLDTRICRLLKIMVSRGASFLRILFSPGGIKICYPAYL